MTDKHLDPKVPARLPAGDLAAGRAELQRHNRSIQDFVVACFRLLRCNAPALLGLLDGHWPAPKKRGRPPKQPG